jgi:tetratricopeptide (TPR) repeat protein
MLLNEQGNALRRRGEPAGAIACYERILDALPGFAPVHYNLAKALSDFGKLEEAATAYRRAVALDPRFAEAWNSLGIILWELGDVDDAVASLRRAIRLRPEFPEAHFNLHSALVDPDDPAQAIACLRRVVALRPLDAEAHLHLGVLLDHSGQSGAAAPHLEAAKAGPPWTRAGLDSYEYVKAHAGARARLIRAPRDAFRLALAAAPARGLVLEFGVRFGASVRQITALAAQPVHGFDSFEGLPEAWHDEPGGSYSTQGELPEVPSNVTLHAGWFEETLPPFLAAHPGPVRFVNIDCDLYSSTKTVLDLLAPRIVPGTTMVFDEYFGNERWREDEHRALQECAARHGWRYDYLGFSLCTRQAVVRIRAS